MRSLLPLAVVVVVGCKPPPVVAPRDTVTMQHPSAVGSVPANLIGDPATGMSISLTTVTPEQICIDANVTATGLAPTKAIETASKYIGKKQYELGPCRERHERFTESCADATPWPVTQTFPPRIVEVFESKHASVSNVKTGNRESVCVEDLTNRRGSVVGCARYVDQDETKEVWNTGTLHRARGGWRVCFPNAGQIGPTTSQFDVAVGVTPKRFLLTGGRATSTAWGGSGGTAVAPTEASAPREATREPVEGGPRPPVTREPGPPRPASSATSDPLRMKAGRAFAIASLEIRRSGKVIVAVEANGTVHNRGTQIGRWTGAVYEAGDGTATMVVSDSGEIWTRARRDATPTRVARLIADRLELEDGLVFTLERDGRVRRSRGQRAEISMETISTTREARPLALVMAFVAGLRYSAATR